LQFKSVTFFLGGMPCNNFAQIKVGISQILYVLPSDQTNSNWWKSSNTKRSS